jgi:diguanylate cyclase (GGDEF)-like protein/PAS domain S-box-containing protein
VGQREARGFAARSASRNPRLFQDAMESLGAGLVVADATEDDLPIAYANAAFERLTGYSRDEVTGRNCRFLHGPGTDPDAVAEMRAAIREGRHARVTVLNYRKDGTAFWNEVSLSPLFGRDGKLLQYIGFQHDVSDREVALERLREAEERYRGLAENVPGVVTYVAEYNGRLSLTYMSPQVERLFGYPVEAWLGERPIWVEALHPDDRDRVLEHERRRFEEGEPFNLEYRLRRADGGFVWVCDRDTVTSSPDDATRRHEGVLVDVTDIKEAELALARSRERHRSVINALDDGVIVLGSRGEVLSANPSVTRIIGFDPRQGDPAELWSRFERYWEDGTPATLENSVGARVLETGEPARDVLMQFRRPDGELRWVSLNYQRVTRSMEPDARELVVSFRDVTRRRGMDEVLRRSEERLRSVISSAPVILWAIDVDGDVSLVEGRGLKAIGMTPSELMGRSMEEIRAFDPEALAVARRALAGEDLTATFEFGGAVFESHLSPMRDERGQIVGALGVAVDVTERQQAEDRLSHMALHDSLTGLPNRSLFIDRLDHALRRGRRHGGCCGVLFIDLDRFKRINDSLGHRAGDHILLETAERITNALRADDTVARLGGDEFTVLCEGVTGAGEVLEVAEKVGQELGHLYELDEGQLYMTASIGVALSDDGSSPEQLLRDADAAMYRAKGRGRGRAELFDEVSRSHTVNRLALESALHGAVDRGEFQMHYQPNVSVATGRVVGYEALLRWDHPTRGRLVPDDFISVAEDSGLIVPIGEWALIEAAAQAARWAERCPEPPLMCVNLSARQFAQPDIVDIVAAALERTGVDAESICLEITETIAMEQGHAAAATLGELKDLGVRLALDDFGTGYSSLGYLQRFRLDYLKIDRSFVAGLGRDPEHTAIVDAMVKLAQALDLCVIAEGVETTEQLAALRALGCDLVQGYLFAKPEPADVAGALLDGPSLMAGLLT